MCYTFFFFLLEMNQHLDHFIASKALDWLFLFLGKFLFFAALSLDCNL